MESQDVQQSKTPACRIVGFDGGLTVIIPPSIRKVRHPFGIALVDIYNHVVMWLAVTDQDEYGNPLPRWEFNSGLDCLDFLLIESVHDMRFEPEVILSSK